MFDYSILNPRHGRFDPALAGAEGRGLRLPTFAHSFKEAWQYVLSTAMFNAVFCSRRAGKSSAAIPRAVLMLARPGTWTHYVNLIRRNARKQFWRPLIKFLEATPAKGGLGWKRGEDFWVSEGDMILTTAWGSNLQAMSCSSLDGVKGVQGDRSNLFIIDECHLPNDDILEQLVAVASPMLTDWGGMLDLLGLPPTVEGSFFSKAVDGGHYATFNWDMFAHDFPRPREEKLASVLEVCKNNGYQVEIETTIGPDGRPKYEPVVANDNDEKPRTHPWVLWAYFGRRAVDPSKLAYEYLKPRNDYDPATVDWNSGKWHTGWGLDLGWEDQDAIVVGRARADDPERKIRVVWQWAKNHIDIFVLADICRCVREVLRPTQVSGDHGGHGATAILETIGGVLGLNIERKPEDVMPSVRLVNNDFRAARLLIPTRDIYTAKILEVARRLFRDEPERLLKVEEALAPEPIVPGKPKRQPDLAAELGLVTKSINARTKKIEINKKGFHSNLTEANRMMHSCLLRPPSKPLVVTARRPEAPDEAADFDREQRRAADDRAMRKKKAAGRW